MPCSSRTPEGSRGVASGKARILTPAGEEDREICEGRNQKSQEGAIHSFIGTLRAPTTHSRLLEIREGFMVEVTLEASPESYIGALHVEDRVEAFQTTPCRRECCFLEHRRQCTGDSSQWLQPSWG